jgi:hypothetical protein
MRAARRATATIPIVFSIVGASFIEDGPGTLEPLRMTPAVGRPGREMADVSLDAQGAVQGSVPGTIQRTAEHHLEQDHLKGNAQDWLSGLEKSNLTPRMPKVWLSRRGDGFREELYPSALLEMFPSLQNFG